MISEGLDIDRVLHYVFMKKYSKFNDNIGSGNYTDTFCQNTNKFQKSGRVLHPSKPPPSHSACPCILWYTLDIAWIYYFVSFSCLIIQSLNFCMLWYFHSFSPFSSNKLNNFYNMNVALSFFFFCFTSSCIEIFPFQRPSYARFVNNSAILKTSYCWHV